MCSSSNWRLNASISDFGNAPVSGCSWVHSLERNSSINCNWLHLFLCGRIVSSTQNTLFFNSTVMWWKSFGRASNKKDHQFDVSGEWEKAKSHSTAVIDCLYLQLASNGRKEHVIFAVKVDFRDWKLPFERLHRPTKPCPHSALPSSTRQDGIWPSPASYLPFCSPVQRFHKTTDWHQTTTEPIHIWTWCWGMPAFQFACCRRFGPGNWVSLVL